MELSATCALAANAGSPGEDKEWPDVYRSIIASNLPTQEKVPGRIAQEVFTLMFASSSSTARVLTRATFHVASDTKISQRLRQELRTIMPDPSTSPALEQLEALPYLVSNGSSPLRLFALRN